MSGPGFLEPDPDPDPVATRDTDTDTRTDTRKDTDMARTVRHAHTSRKAANKVRRSSSARQQTARALKRGEWDDLPSRESRHSTNRPWDLSDKAGRQQRATERQLAETEHALDVIFGARPQ